MSAATLETAVLRDLSYIALVVGSVLAAGDWLHAQAPRVPVDELGDALPAGAIGRIGSVRLQHGHTIRHLAFAPDGKTLASSSHDKTIRVWETATGRELHRLAITEIWEDGLPHAYEYFAFAPDSRTLAAVQGDHLALLDLSTGKVRVEVRGYSRYFAFAPDGKTLIAVYHSSVVLWDTATGKMKREWKHDRTEEHPFYRCAFAPDGKTMAIGDFSKESSIHLWDIGTGEKVREWKAHANYIRELEFTPDGKAIVSVSDDESARLWEAATGKEVRAWTKQRYLYHMALSPDGKTLALCRIHDPLLLIDWTTGKELGKLEKGFGPVAFSPDGKLLAISESSNGIRLWDLAAGKRLVPAGEVVDIAYSPNGKRLVSRGPAGVRLWHSNTGKADRLVAADAPFAVCPSGLLALVRPGPEKAEANVTVVDLKTGKERGRFPVDRDHILPARWSDDGRVLVLATDEPAREDLRSADSKSLLWWDTGTGKEIRRLEGDLVVCSPDGRLAAVLTHTRPGPIEEFNGGNIRRLVGPLRVIDVGTGKDLFSIADASSVALGGILSHCAFEPVFSTNGAVLATASADGAAVRLWEVKSGRKLSELAMAEFAARQFTLSPDGKLLVVEDNPPRFGEKRSLRLVRSATGQPIHRLDSSYGDACAFSADGALVAAVDLYGKVTVWEAATGCQLRTWKPDAIKIKKLVFSPDGSSLTTLNSDGTALVWDLASRADATAKPPTDHELDQFWSDLASPDAERADRAIRRAVAVADRTVPFLKTRLLPVPVPDADRLRKLIADLSSDRFAVREKAQKELGRLGDVVGPALEEALAARPPVDLADRLTAMLAAIENRPWDADRLRTGRAVRALEYVCTADTRQILERLAAGAPGAELTRAAKAAMDRLAWRTGP
jgi:WD40 repeat protein